MISMKHNPSNVLISAGLRWGLALAAAGLLAAGVSAQTLTIQVRPIVTPVAGSVSTNNVPITTVPKTVAVTALESNPAYAFDRWEIVTNAQFNILADPADPALLVDVTSTSSPAIVRAWFKSRGLSLIVSANPPEGGYTQNPGLGTNWLATNQVVNITATASNGYEFVNWSGAAAGSANPATFTMSFSQSIAANFAKVWAVSMANWDGPASLITNTLTVRSGALTNLTPASVFAGATSTRRSRCNGWTAGTGSVSPTSATGADKANVYVTVNTNSSLSWSWATQFKVTTTNTPTGYIQLEELASPADNDAGDGWVDSNTSVRVTLVANDPAKYEPDYVLVNGVRQDLSPTYDVVLPPVTGALNLVPVFRVSSQDDPGYIAYMKGFGLVAGSVGQRTFDDPDLDGLTNQEEYRLSNTNKSWYYNPINSDTDGDGMDDAYETGSVDPTNLTDQARTTLRPAATDDGGHRIDNGASGNPDGDYKWSVTDGYMQPALELLNIEEYRGPDGTPPWTRVTLNFGEIYVDIYGVTNAYPFASNPAGFRPAVHIRVPVAGDTGDQSKGNTAFTDKDPFDDGFEYSWDQWQQANAGYEEPILVGITNAVAVSITNTVPAWPGARVFNPGVVSVPGAGPDYDILYDYASGKVSLHYYTAEREYNAWTPDAFSPGINAPHSIRMDTPPTMPEGVTAKRSSHPFLWDVDLDGLPDGYEVIFGYDPWTPFTPGALRADGEANPDGDWMAKAGTNALALRNHEVYLTNGFNAHTAVDQVYPDKNEMPGPGTKPSPDTVTFSNIDELRGPDGLMALAPSAPAAGADDATNPTRYDSDGDGMWDGWECYVGLNPSGDTDAAPDADGDEVSNLDEFRSFYTSSTNREALTPLPEWQNKIFPSDPGIDPSPADPDTAGGKDTDADGVKDGDEKTKFFNGDTYGGMAVTNLTVDLDEGTVTTNVAVYGVWQGSCYLGGGLNPCSSDTDTDTLPDPFEACFSGGLDGTRTDPFEDPDNDRLQNYQEYWGASVYHWQNDVWTNGLSSYDNADFFQGTPKSWDWIQNPYIPLFGPQFKYGPFGYAGPRPTSVDTDDDGMDDYYEIYHGLNPIWGTMDCVLCRDFGEDGFPPLPPLSPVGDPRTQPWVAGHPLMDPDGDGLKNYEEAPGSVFPAQAPRTHTDPSPLWMTDAGYDRSWVNLYYRPRPAVWFWFDIIKAPPTYAFNFESNEGYDTDNDGHSDKEELNVTKTDPLTPERPVKRRALYLPTGVDAYARTYPGYAAAVSEPGGGWLPGINVTPIAGDALRSFTVEAWVRPLNPASGVDQIVVERPIMITSGNPMNLTPGIRLNFRLAIGADGKPYIAYTGEGAEPVYGDVKVSAATAVTTNWTHLAATYQVASYTSANEGGVLTLYVNGEVAARQPFSQLPATGAYDIGGEWTELVGAPVLVGAADANPNGTFGSVANQPQPSLFFKGWLDEVRVWDGARSDAQIQAAMRTQLRQADVLAQQAPAPTLRYLYTFDGLPDPQHAATEPGAPIGFDVTATAIFPAGWAAVEWAASPQKSQVYTDYRYVPWIENIAAHVPELPAEDVGDTNLFVYVSDGTNTVIARAKFWNTSNPYGVRYFTSPGRGYEKFHQYNDLLPLGYAQADEDTQMWDNNTVPSAAPYDSDGDGLPDGWEEFYGLDPLDPNGENGGYGDPDQDGLHNLAELLAGTNPMNADTFGFGFGDYHSWSGTVFRTFGELYTDRDGLPDDWEIEHGLDPRMYDAYGIYGDPDGDGWANFPEYLKETDPRNAASRPNPSVNGIIKYEGVRTNGSVVVLGYQSSAMDGVPIRGTSDGEVFRIEGLRDGVLYLHAFRDNNGNGQWDSGEPAGLAERQPIRLGWEDIQGVVIGLTDDPPTGHLRFMWPQVEGQASYIVRVTNKSQTGQPLVFAFTNNAPQNGFHEGHMNHLGVVNLAAATYEWFAKQSDGVTSITSGVCNVSNPALTKPVLLSPAGSKANYTPMEVVWSMGSGADRFRLQISRTSTFASLVLDQTTDAPFRAPPDPTSSLPYYKHKLPIYPGDGVFTNGLYYWRVQALNNQSASSWSDSSQFTLELVDPPAGASAISGNVKYYGKVGGTNVITILVQAFNNGGFGGEPLAQVTVTNRPSQALIDSLTNALTPSAQMPTPFDKGGYKFMGLRSGTYYVRAFMDGNANGVIDGWETQGFVADTQGRPRGVLVGTQSVIMDHHLTLFDRDFDSDRLPDAWEWLNFATFRWTGDDDPNVTGVTLITHFAESYFDSDPTQPVNPLVAYEMNNGLRPGYDSDGDGLSDAVEVLVTRTDRLRAADVLRARGIVTTPPGMGMSLTWEGKDGVTYQVQKSADLKAWTDAAAGTYSGAGTKTFVDAGASNVVLRFYRIIVK